MTNGFLRFLKTAQSFIGALQYDIEAVRQQRSASESKKEPPQHITGKIEISLPPSVNDYYDSESKEGHKGRRRDRIRLVIEGLTLAAAIIASVYAVRALRQVIRQADAAEDQAQSARQSTIISQQASVFFSMAINRSPIIDAGAIRAKGWTFSIPVVNTGNTPTKNMYIKGRAYLDGTLTGKYEDASEEGPRIFIPPHVSYETIPSYISVDRIRMLNKSPIYFYGWANYRDVFDVSDKTPQHITMYCFQMSGYAGDPVIPNASFNPTYSPCLGKHNCADDECDSEPYAKGQVWRAVKR